MHDIVSFALPGLSFLSSSGADSKSAIYGVFLNLPYILYCVFIELDICVQPATHSFWLFI